MLKKLFSKYFKKKCKHEFMYSNLHQTGLEIPEFNPYNHPNFKKRVQWKCHKCGEIFFAHCGLDILKLGKIADEVVNPGE